MAKRAEETRNQMMQNLFGDQSEEEDDDEEVDSEHEAAANRSDFHSDEGEGEPEIDGEGDVEGQGEVELESEAEAQDIEMDQAESEGERVQSSQEHELSDQRMRSDEKDAESEDGYGQRVATSRRREVVQSESEGSEDNRFADRGNEDEADQARMPRSPEEEKENEVVRDVFGDSDEDEPASYGAQKEVEQDSHRSPMEDEGIDEKDMRPEDTVPDEDAHYESEDEKLEQKVKEKPTGPPLDLEIPLRPPPCQSDAMNMIRVSNIMGIERKPFDPKTYVEEDVFVTDESGAQKRIRLEDNIVRCRAVKNRNGSISYESNARFVKWSDGSLQLLIGNEVLDISVQEADHDQRHLFLRHGKGILQSQGRLLRNMKFRPSSLSSKSHRLLTAIVDSRHKKIYKVKNCITDIDPEREKEEKEKVEGQNIRANQLLHKKREKVNRKYATPASKGRQLSPGFLEDALEEEEPEDYHSSRRASNRRFEDDLEGELRAEKRIINAKRPQIHKNISQKSSVPSARASRRPVEEHSDSEREESEYETDGEDIEGSPSQIRGGEREDEYEEEAEEEEAEDLNSASEEEEKELKHKFKETGGHSLKRKDIELDEDSPPRKVPVNRRKAVVFDSDEE